jgi:hypothetical protein
MENKIQEGFAKIGLGEKIHPAYINENGFLFFQCRCPGTSNGWAMNAARFFSKSQYPNLTRTCRVGK